MSSARDGSVLFTGVPLLGDHTTHSSINVDNDAIVIDADASDHVISIKHTPGDGINVLTASNKDTGAITCRIDSNGKYYGNILATTVQADTILYGTGLDKNVEIDITALETHINAADAADPGNTNNLVLRSVSNGTEIDNLHVIGREAGYTKSYPPAGLYFTQGTCSDSLDLIGQGQLTYHPYDGSGSPIESRTFNFGRTVPVSGETRANADARRDGLLVEDSAVDHTAEIMCSNQLPTIRLIGSKETTTDVNSFTYPVAPVIEVRDGSGNRTFAVYHDGFVIQRGHTDTDPDALNAGHFESVVAGDGSVFVGSGRLSYDRTAHQLTLHTLKHQIPTFLQGHSLGIGSVPLALNAMTVHGWVALARTFLSNHRLEVSDVFPSTNTGDWNPGGFGALQHTGDTTFENVGIGTSSPTHMLHVHDTSGNAELRISRDLSDNHILLNTHSLSKWGNGTGNTPFKFRIISSDPMVFETSNTEQLRIAPNGYVGIGTNNPQSKLDLVGSFTLNGTALTATATELNGLDARVTTEKNRVDAILNLSAAELDTFKEIEDAYKAADSSITTTVTNLQSTHNSDIATLTTATALNTAKVGITSGQTSAITVNTTKVGITSGQITSITTNNLKYTTTQVDALLVDQAHTGDTSFENVGIGTSSPTHMLHVHDTGGNAALRISRDLSDNHIQVNESSFSKVGNGSGNTPYKFRIITADPMVFETSNTEQLRIAPNGYVGIGTNNPQSKLDLVGSLTLNGTALTATATELNGFDARLDTAEAKSSFTDPTTQTLLTAETNARTTAVALKSNIASPTFTTKIVTPMVEAASNLELKATGSNAIKFYTDGSERCKVTSAGNILFSTGLGLNLSKPVQSAIEWSAHQDVLTVTINTVRSASIPIYSSFNMSGVQRFFLEVTSDQITGDSLIVAHTYSPNNYETWLPQVSNLRSMYVSASAGKFRITGAVSGTHSMSGNSTTNLYVNYMIM